MTKKKKIGKPIPEMEKYLTPDAYDFLKRLYAAVGTEELYTHGTINDSHSIGSVEDIFKPLGLLVPHKDQVISALELMSTLPEDRNSSTYRSAIFRTSSCVRRPCPPTFDCCVSNTSDRYPVLPLLSP